MPKQFHVQLIETPVDGDNYTANELLPWADPYIAQLMGQLEHEDETWDFEGKDDEAEDGFLNDELPEDWHLDREARFPPVYGGWPLLNDLTPEGRHEVA
ncbi:hypothetical protein [Anatilimnocola floriformis]|uniref:hypothetical protein n=1 Tax=Anatilimnocola floriformis TaxID=2948575 RepID=UPI0020C264DA|nr:hypothetical protein [Anatilimnocola floriformis]